MGTVTPFAIAIKIDIIRPDNRHQNFVTNPYRADSRPLRASPARRPGVHQRTFADRIGIPKWALSGH